MRNARNESVADFLERFSMPEPTTGCQLWLGGEKPGGYGRAFWLGRMHQAHRLAYEAKIGPIPDGLMVRHKCDTPLCINPAHLEVGTHADNMRDRDLRNRTARGERSGLRLHPERILRGEAQPGAKLNNAKVRRIRMLLALGAGRRSLALRFGVSYDTIRLIEKRLHWGHVQ
jgi:hypothetical protein